MLGNKKGLEGTIEHEEEQNEDLREITIITSTILVGVFRLIKVFKKMIDKEND